MELTDAIKLLKTHYHDKHTTMRPCGFTVKQTRLFEDLFQTKDGVWLEEDPHETKSTIVSVYCTECDTTLKGEE